MHIIRLIRDGAVPNVVNLSELPARICWWFAIAIGPCARSCPECHKVREYQFQEMET